MSSSSGARSVPSCYLKGNLEKIQLKTQKILSFFLSSHFKGS